MEYGDFKDRRADDFDFPCSPAFRGYYNDTYGYPRHDGEVHNYFHDERQSLETSKKALAVAVETRRLFQQRLSDKGRGGSKPSSIKYIYSSIKEENESCLEGEKLDTKST